MTDAKTHYEVLGLHPEATEVQIINAYKYLSTQHHPDKPGGSTEAQAALNVAKETLLDPEKRAHYDKTGAELPRASIDDKAIAMLTAYFNMMIDQEQFGTDLVIAIAFVLSKTHEANEEAHGKSTNTIARLARQLGRMKSKDGPNYFECILLSKIKDHEARIEAADLAKQVLDRAKELLNDFEDGRPPAGMVSDGSASYTYVRTEGFT